MALLQRVFEKCLKVPLPQGASKIALLKECFTEHRGAALSPSYKGSLLQAFRSFVDGEHGYSAMEVSTWDGEKHNLALLLEKIAVASKLSKGGVSFVFSSEADLVNTAVCRLRALGAPGDKAQPQPHQWEVAEPLALEALQVAFADRAGLQACNLLAQTVEHLPGSASVCNFSLASFCLSCLCPRS